MHRKNFLTQLDNYSRSPWCKFEGQKEKLEIITKFVNDHSDCFERKLSHGHLTGSSWLVNKTGNKFLLTHHKKLGIWIQLGGHADGDNDMLNVSLREAQEESGIEQISPLSNEIFDIDIHEIPTHKDVPAHIHYDIRYLFRVTSDTNYKVSDESIDLKWFNVNNELLNFNPSLQLMLTKWRLWNKPV